MFLSYSDYILEDASVWTPHFTLLKINGKSRPRARRLSLGGDKGAGFGP